MIPGGHREHFRDLVTHSPQPVKLNQRVLVRRQSMEPAEGMDRNGEVEKNDSDSQQIKSEKRPVYKRQSFLIATVIVVLVVIGGEHFIGGTSNNLNPPMTPTLLVTSRRTGRGWPGRS